MYARISAETIQQVNDQTDLVSLIGEYTRLERRGSEWWGCCPFHSEKTPSFHVAPDKHLYHCFGCGQGGNAISFCMEMEKISFADAVKELAQKAGIEIKYDGRNAAPQQQDESGAKQKELYKELYSRMAGTFQFLLTQTEAGRFAYDYVKRRGISEETARTFMLGYAPADRMWLRRFLEGKHYSAGFLDESGLFSKKNPRSAFFYDRLLFPIFDRRGDAGHSGRTSQPGQRQWHEPLRTAHGEARLGPHLGPRRPRLDLPTIRTRQILASHGVQNDGYVWSSEREPT